VPIIVAVITAIVGPTYAYYYLVNHPSQQQPPFTPAQQPPPQVQNSSLSVRTDKNPYGVGDYVEVSGTVGKPMQGKTVRLDVYDPKGRVFEPYNATFSAGDREDWTPAYPHLSDIQVKPNDKGLFSYRFPVDRPVFGPIIKGTYKIEVTYEGTTKNATFTVR
jgi:hypothetical protein